MHNSQFENGRKLATYLNQKESHRNDSVYSMIKCDSSETKQYVIAAKVVRQLLALVPAPSVESANSPLCSSLLLLGNDTFLCRIYILGLNHLSQTVHPVEPPYKDFFLSGLGSTFSAILFLESPCCVVNATKTGYRKMPPNLSRHVQKRSVITRIEALQHATGNHMNGSRIKFSC